MQDPIEKDSTRRDLAGVLRMALPVTLLLVIAMIALRPILQFGGMDEAFFAADSDSVLRLVSIRNWMAGQSWFDMTVYRMLPPDGVLIHWSRYVDAMIGGLIVLFSFFMSQPQAEMLAVSFWPPLLQVIMIGVIGIGAKRLFGSLAACFAVLGALTWPITGQLYFRPGAIDHHNVQILALVIMTIAAVSPDRPTQSGLIAGIAAGFALAVGLETLPYILLLGLILFVRATWALSPQAGRLLMVFCIALAISAIVFWLGQTPASRLGAPVCDQLGLPVLSLIAIATLASCAPMLLGVQGTYQKLLISLGMVGLGFVVAWPILGECVAGPYGSLPVEVQDIIRKSIVEAVPGLRFAQRDAALYGEIMLPIVVALGAAGAMWMRIGKEEQEDRTRRDVVGQLLILSAVGIVASFSQTRLVLMAAGAVPLLVGFVMAALVSGYLTSRASTAAVKMLLTGLVALSPNVLMSAAAQIMAKDAFSPASLDRNCREKTAIESLNALPPAVFLSPMNLSAIILLQTHHSVLSGPYHRSPGAFANGAIPFRLAEANMQAYLERIGAEYVAVCEGSDYGDGFGTALAEGATAVWLEPVDLGSEPIMVFKVIQDDGSQD